MLPHSCMFDDMCVNQEKENFNFVTFLHALNEMSKLLSTLNIGICLMFDVWQYFYLLWQLASSSSTVKISNKTFPDHRPWYDLYEVFLIFPSLSVWLFIIFREEKIVAILNLIYDHHHDQLFNIQRVMRKKKK